jgi:hypothetical protein
MSHVSLKKAGTSSAANDMWIAASAMQHGLPILTSDRDFQKFPRSSFATFLLSKKAKGQTLQPSALRPPRPIARS